MRLLGIGVDLVSIPRMRQFLKRHGAKAVKLLDPQAKSRKISALRLARLFAAKEAVFKALNRSWMGIEGFQAIQVKSSHSSGFRVECAFLPKGAQVSGRFFDCEGLAGAQVMIWRP